MHTRTAACSLAIAALALAGCGGDDAREPATQPDVYVPESGPPREPAGTEPPRRRTEAERLQCVPPGTGDAGDRRPTRSDPRTLILRLRDLPKGFGFAVGYQEGGVGIMPLTEVGDTLGEAVDAAGAELTAARGKFGRGRLTPPPPNLPPGAPPPPAPGCPDPETEVAAGAVVASSPEGAHRIYELARLLAGSMAGADAPHDFRERTSPAPVALGEEAKLIEHESVPRGRMARVLAWRDGRIVAFVQVIGDGGRADVSLLAQAAQRQAEYVRAVR